MSTPIYARDAAPLAAIEAEPDRPILLAHGQVLTRDATIGDWADADVLLGSGVVFGVGPGLESAADDDGMIVMDCRGCLVMPSGSNGEARIAPAEPATIAVYRLADLGSASAEPGPDRPSHLDILLVDGRPVIWGGVPVDGTAASEPAPRPTR